MNDKKSNIKTGIIWNSIASLSRYVLQFGGIMILARLLSPHDYGVFGLMAIFISIAEVLMDGGLCAAVIKKENATDVDFSTLSIYNICASLVLYIIYFTIAPYIESFYDCPRLSSYIRIYSISIIFHGVVMAPRTYAIKNMKFKVLSLITMIAGFCGLLVAIVMAYCGFGVYSLIGQYVTYSFFYTFAIFLKSKYKVKLGFSRKSFNEQFAFGINTTIANALKTLSENIYNNVIGKTCQLNQVGFYTQSSKLMQVPVGFFYNLIDTTFFPIMSQIHDKNDFTVSIIKLNVKSIKIIFVLFTIAISLNNEIVYFLLGKKWHGMEWTLMMLLISGLFITWGNIGRNLIKCTGKTFLILKYEAVIFLISMIALFVSAKIGYTYIVVSFLIISIVKSVYINKISNREIGIEFKEILKPITSLFVCGCVYIILSCFITHEVLLIRILLKVAILSIIALFYICCYERKKIQVIINKITKK